MDAAAPPATEIRPQEGPQTQFLSSFADIVIYGGAAGGGKSYGLLLDPLRYITVPGFGAVIFRRESPQITNQGGLWDTSQEFYPLIKGAPKRSDLSWFWPRYGTKIRFAHLQHDKDKLKWQGAQVPYIGFDELTHFTEDQFFYMLSRNRSTCGVNPCVRATCNPAPGWVRDLIAAWVVDGHENPAASGEVRYFTRKAGEIIWVDPSWRDADGGKPKSLTFIRSTVYDNKILLATNPEYLANLRALPLIEQERLLGGNWNIFAGAFFTEWTEALCTVDPCEVTGGEFFGGLDWGKQNPFSFGLYWQGSDGDILGIDEEHEAGLSNHEQATRILRCLERNNVPKDRYGRFKCRIAADPSMFPPKDPSKRIGEYNIEEFQKAGLDVVPAINDRVNGWTRVKEYLHAGKFKAFRGKCKALIREFPLAKYRDKHPEDMDDDGDTQGHFDALNRHRYAMMQLGVVSQGWALDKSAQAYLLERAGVKPQ